MLEQWSYWGGGHIRRVVILERSCYRSYHIREVVI